MSRIFIALLVVPLLQAGQANAGQAPAGKIDAGKAYWQRTLCKSCHGEEGQGGFAPDLAGRGLSFDEVKRAVRKPWGIMGAYTESQVSDQTLADLQAYFASLPKADKPGDWHWMPAPETAALGQRLYIQTVGCGECHEPENKMGRAWMGEKVKDATFEYFQKVVYNHSDTFPKGGMPNFSRDRVPESTLREIYKWFVDDLGLRASIAGGLAVGEQQGGNTTYNLTVTNKGAKEKGGLGVEGVTIFVRIPPGTKVLNATGTGYTGVMPLAKLGLEPGLPLAPHAHDATGHVERPQPDLSGDVAVWKVKSIDAGEKLACTFTLSGAPTAEVFKGFDGSTVYWETPGRRPAGSPPVMVYRDLRTPDKGDHERIALPRPLVARQQ